MKKLKYITLMFIMMFACVINVSAITYGTQEECRADVKTVDLSKVSGKATTRSCVQNFCDTGTLTYNYYYVQLATGYGVCANGNRSPYTISTYGFNRTGRCGGQLERVYTNMDTVYDCTRTANGQTYQQTTTTKKQNTTKKTTTTKKQNTTASTTKKTGPTTTSTFGGNETTSSQRVTSPGENTTSTTEPTTQAVTNDASIRRIVINDKFDLGYTSDKNEYSIKVPYSMAYFDVYVETNDSSASVEVNGADDITSTGGTINIRVTSSDATTTNEVKINVSRYTKEEGDCSLAQILIKDYNIDFSSSKEQYTIQLANGDRYLDIEVVPTNVDSIYTIHGNEKLKNNSKIEIQVEAVDGTTCTYMITTKKSSKLLLYLFIFVILGVGLFFAVKKIIQVSTKGKNRYRYE